MATSSLKLRLLAPLAVTLGIVVTAFVLIVYDHEREHIQEEMQNHVDYVSDLFQSALASDGRLMGEILQGLVSDENLTDALRGADRDALLAGASPHFERLRVQHRITHLYFISPERTVILRVHDPDRAGDTVDHLSLANAARNAQMASGLELGALGTFTLRVVSPWYDGEELIGYVEIGEEITHLVHKLSEVLDVMLLVAIDKSLLVSGDWEAGTRMPGLPDAWDAFESVVVRPGSRGPIPDGLTDALRETGWDMSADMSSVEAGGRQYMLGAVTLADAGGRDVGKLAVLRDMTDDLQSADRSAMMASAICIGLVALLIAFFYGVAQRTERALTKSQRALVGARDALEIRVAERTAELAQANQALQAEVEERRRAEHAWGASEARYRELVESANSIILRRDLEGRITFVNKFAQDFFGYSERELIGRSIVGTIVPETESTGRDLAGMTDDISRHPEKHITNENENIRRDGGRVWIAWTNKAVQDEAGKVVEILSVGNDITARKQAEDELRLMASVFRHSIEGIVITDREGNIIQVNKGFCDITGYAEEEVTGRNYRVLTSTGHDQMLHDNMWNALEQAGYWQGEIWNRRKNGEIYPQWLGVSSVRDAHGEVISYIGVFTDMTEKKLTEKRIYRLAHYDAITDLPNRVLFQDRLEQALSQANRTGSQVALLYLDLDRFKPINDSLGHHVGDLLLKAVADRLRGSVRESDTVTRMGGDEFTVIVPGILRAREIVPTASAIAQKIVRHLSQPFHLDGHEVFITTSVGIASYPQDGQSSAELVKNADSAMYHAKEQGGRRHMFYEERMNTAAAERLLMEHSLRKGLERGEFQLYYQPSLTVSGGEVRSVEALLRWNQPELGMVAPEQFVPLAEDTGLIVQLGEWVLREACRQARAWDAAGLGPLRVAVNLSLRQLRDRDLVETIRTLLDETGLGAERLALEITESTFVEHAQDALAVLDDLSGFGIHLMIDDFGTGYSSLGYLKRIPIASVKIDRCFVHDITTDPDNAAIVAAIIAMAHQLRLNVVAEGVETEEQLAFLRSHGCDEIQGYLVSKPLGADALTRLLEEGPDALALTRRVN